MANDFVRERGGRIEVEKKYRVVLMKGRLTRGGEGCGCGASGSSASQWQHCAWICFQHEQNRLEDRHVGGKGRARNASHPKKLLWV